MSAILAVTLVTSAGALDATTLVRRLFLTGAIAAMLSVAIHLLRGRLVESNARTARLLRHEEALNAAVRELVQLSEPPQITALGARLAMGIASPAGSEILRASYFRIEDGMVIVDAQLDDAGTDVPGALAGAGAPRPARGGGLARAGRGAARPGQGGADTAGGVRRHRASRTAPGSRSVPTGGCTASWPSPPGAPPFRRSASSGASPWATSWSSRSPTGPPTARWRSRPRSEERRRIARELHDGLAHELAFIASKTRGAAAGTAAPPDARALAGAADRALDEARRAITVLSVSQPQSLDDAISQTVEDLGSRLGVAWDLQLADDVEVPGEVRENLLRIVREAITNAASHGASEHVRVSLERDDQLRLVIEDDGCGFDPDRPCAAGGFGLQSMQERAASVGAVLSVDSVPERGTRVAVAFR